MSRKVRKCDSRVVTDCVSESQERLEEHCYHRFYCHIASCGQMFQPHVLDRGQSSTNSVAVPCAAVPQHYRVSICTTTCTAFCITYHLLPPLSPSERASVPRLHARVVVIAVDASTVMRAQDRLTAGSPSSAACISPVPPATSRFRNAASYLSVFPRADARSERACFWALASLEHGNGWHSEPWVTCIERLGGLREKILVTFTSFDLRR